MKKIEIIQRGFLEGILIILLSVFLNSCSKDESKDRAVDSFTVDLTDPTYAVLKNVGAYVVIAQKQIMIVHYSDNPTLGIYFATDSQCTSCQGTLDYDVNTNFHCKNCNSRWNSGCAVLNGPATVALKAYKVNKSGDILTVWLN